MMIFGKLYKRIGRWPNSLFLLAVKLARRFGDSEVNYLICRTSVILPLSHALPIYQKLNIHYDRLPIRLGQFLREKFGSTRCIDVGANVGDTIAALAEVEDDKFLAIEPNNKFSYYLTKNWGGDPRVVIRKSMISRMSGTVMVKSREFDGTNSIREDQEDGQALNVESLDDILNSGAVPDELNFIKIDTDGYDFEVIMGAQALIAKCFPFVLFECGVFDNQNYLNGLREVVLALVAAGYHDSVIYDNRGFLVGRFPLEVDGMLEQLQVYQFACGVEYYDVLVMPPSFSEDFYLRELRVFSAKKTDISAMS